MFDLKTFKALGSIPAAEDADAILFDPPSNRVFSLNGDAHSSTVIDVGKDALVTNIPSAANPSTESPPATARSTPTSPTPAKSSKSTPNQPPSPAAGPPPPANSRSPWPSIKSITASSADAAAESWPSPTIRPPRCHHSSIGTGVDGAGYDPAAPRIRLKRRRNPHCDPSGQSRSVSRSQTLTTPIGSRNMGLDPTNHRLFVVSAEFGPAPTSGRGRGPVLPAHSPS